MLLVSTLFTCVLLSRVESKKPDKAVTELLSSTPPPADGGGDRQEVSVKTRMEDQGPQWPVREMIAILGGYSCDMYTRAADWVFAGGVLGFWGGVGLMGTIFLLVLVTQRCCSRRASQEKKEVSRKLIQHKVDAHLSSGLVM